MAAHAAVLVTGMSGTGKSTALAALAERGHRVVDTDDPGWTVLVDGEPLWDLERVRGLLDEPTDGPLFVSGCVANQGAVYARFDAVVLLSAPVDILLARVARRVNPYGSTASDQARIAADAREFEHRIRAGATHELDATRPAAAVADALEDLANSVGRRRRSL